MKNQVKVALLAGGILVSLASLVPLTTYAADPVEATDDVTITAIVNPSISIDTAEGFTVKGDSGKVLSGNILATVKSNTKYTITIKPATSQTAMVATESSDTIPASADVRENNRAWAIKSKSSNGIDGNYVAIDTTAGQTLFTSAGTNDGTTPLQFAVGISTDQSITSGTYSIDLTVVAAAAAP